MIPPEFTLRHLETIRRHITNIARRRCLHMNPRRWSNAELRKLAPHFGGDIVNISGFKDEDKEGGHYRDYFTAAETYTITNYAGSGEVGDGAKDSVYLDLEGEPPADLHRRFDTIFCHTVLEHVEKIGPAFATLSHLTRDAMILVVPFLQDEHYRPGIFGDYWRYTPLGLKALFETHGFELLYLSANDTPWYPVYLTAVGARDPGKFPGLPASPWTPEQRVGRLTYVYPKGVW